MPRFTHEALDHGEWERAIGERCKGELFRRVVVEGLQDTT